jgi:chromosome transmission fidelity protein 1
MLEYLIRDGSSNTPGGASSKRSRGTAWDTSSDSDSSSEHPPGATGAAGGSSAPGAPAPRRRTCPQVIFCSRTHSQLSQFVSELHRTCLAEALTLVAVASRKALCINPQVG